MIGDYEVGILLDAVRRPAPRQTEHAYDGLGIFKALGQIQMVGLDAADLN